MSLNIFHNRYVGKMRFLFGVKLSPMVKIGATCKIEWGGVLISVLQNICNEPNSCPFADLCCENNTVSMSFHFKSKNPVMKRINGITRPDLTRLLWIHTDFLFKFSITVAYLIQGICLVYDPQNWTCWNMEKKLFSSWRLISTLRKKWRNCWFSFCCCVSFF